MKKPDGSGCKPVRDRQVCRPVEPASIEGISFEGVHPLRLEEIRKRVGILKSFLSIENVEDEDRINHAKALGLSVNQFLGLVRAWQVSKSPAALDGAGAKRGAHRSTGPRHLPTESKAVALEVIGALGASLTHTLAVDMIERRCSMLNVKPPSRSTIWNMIMDYRRNEKGGTGGDEIVIGRCHVRTPTLIAGKVEFPWIILVVDTKDGAILAAVMQDEDLLQGTVMPMLEQQSPNRSVTVDKDLAPALFGMATPMHTEVKSSAARTAIAKVLGRGIGDLTLLYQVSRAISPAQALITPKDKPLQFSDLEDFVIKELIAHNLIRHRPRPLVSWKSSASSLS